jgi:putative endonuclease
LALDIGYLGMWFVYILLCEDNSLYTGSSNNVGKRFADHLKGKGGKYTRSHKPVKMVFSEKLESKSIALKREIEIKSWTRTQKILRLKLVI